MKKSIAIIGSLTVIAFADLSVKQIETMVQKIHKKRQGVDLATLDKTKEPFVKIIDGNITTAHSESIKEEEVKINLHAIMNGKAFINDGWHKVGDNIFGYKLAYIGKNGIVLRNDHQVKKLFLHKKKNDFIKLVEKGTK